MKKWLFLFVAGIVLVGCSQLLDKPGYTDSDGTRHPSQPGLFTQGGVLGKILGNAGVPFAGLVGIVLGAVGGIGGAVRDARKKRDLSQEDVVRLLGSIKREVESIMSEADFNQLILKFAPPDKSDLGAWLSEMHKKLKEDDKSTDGVRLKIAA